MKVSGTTSLQELTWLGEPERRLLKSLWIESIEELVSVLQREAAARSLPRLLGGRHSTIEDARTGLLGSLPESSRTRVLASVEPMGLGYSPPPTPVAELTARLREADGLHRPRRAGTGPFEKPLPRRVSHREKMQPPRAQGKRGTCVAFASVALRESLEPQPANLSEQFLYWACKQIDGLPADGTTLTAAQVALKQYGVCLERTWPYEPDERASDVTHGSPPENALSEARQHLLEVTEPVQADLVMHYKSILAGDEGGQGRLAVMGTLVFESWYYSPEFHRTGKMTMPLPGEMPMPCGHAWAVVGYVDDEDVPGGGYFVLRNSWGARWAPDSPEAPGHALMPYAYVEMCAVEAFTGAQAKRAVLVDAADADLEPYVRVLARDEKGFDLDGELCGEGDRVLFNPLDRMKFKKHTARNREEFRRRGFAWSDEIGRQWAAEQRDAKRKLWSVKRDRRSDETNRKLDANAARKQEFMSNIERNLLDDVEARREPLAPPLPVFPRFREILFTEPKLRKVERVDHGELTAKLCAKGLSMERPVPEPEGLEELLREQNEIRIYEARWIDAKVYIVVACITPLRLPPGDGSRSPDQLKDLEFVGFGTKDFADMETLCKEWLREQRHESKPYIVFALASQCWQRDYWPVSGGYSWVVAWEWSDETWRNRTGEAQRKIVLKAIARDFLELLDPETFGVKLSRILPSVDGLIAQHEQAQIERGRIRAGLQRRKEEDPERRRKMLEGQNVAPVSVTDEEVQVAFVREKLLAVKADQERLDALMGGRPPSLERISVSEEEIQIAKGQFPYKAGGVTVELVKWTLVADALRRRKARELCSEAFKRGRHVKVEDIMPLVHIPDADVQKALPQIGYRRSVIRRAFFALEDTKHYELGWPQGGDLTIRKTTASHERISRVVRQLREHGPTWYACRTAMWMSPVWVAFGTAVLAPRVGAVVGGTISVALTAFFLNELVKWLRRHIPTE